MRKKTLKKQKDKPKKRLSKKFLIRQIQSLKRVEKSLDRQIRELERRGVKETDYVDIMNSLHEYNEIRDAVAEIFKYCSECQMLTSAQLHVKYGIPTE